MKVIIFIKFLIIGLGHSQFLDFNYDGQDKFPPDSHITLISSGNSYNDDVFYKIASSMGFFVIKVLLDSENSFLATAEIAKNLGNIINLEVPVSNNGTEIVRDWYAVQQSNIICTMHCENLTEKYNNATNFNQKGVRLISETLFNYKGLWGIIGMEKYTYSPPKILVCLPNPDIIGSHKDIILLLDHNKSDPFKNIVSIIFKTCDERTEADDDLLAVIANKPLYGNSEVPTILYQTSYIYPEYKDHFPNSINISPPWRPLKYALTKFLEVMQKHRVAIISDDSEYSANFAEELTSLFLKEGIMFIAEECEGRHCNFTKALNTLYDIGDVQIVVLNVETKQNAKNFIKDLNNYNRFTWIVRDWPFENLKEFPPRYSEAYSLSIFSAYKSIVLDTPVSYLPALYEGLEIIKNVYQKVLGDEELFRRNFVRLANELFKPQAQGILARVSRHRFETRPSPVSDIAIIGFTASVLNFSMSDIPPDGTEECIVLSNHFENACAHEALLLLLIVIIMFALLLLVVVVFFNNYRSRAYARFR